LPPVGSVSFLVARPFFDRGLVGGELRELGRLFLTEPLVDCVGFRHAFTLAFDVGFGNFASLKAGGCRRSE
jgi:hypothetical protein